MGAPAPLPPITLTVFPGAVGLDSTPDLRKRTSISGTLLVIGALVGLVAALLVFVVRPAVEPAKIRPVAVEQPAVAPEAPEPAPAPEPEVAAAPEVPEPATPAPAPARVVVEAPVVVPVSAPPPPKPRSRHRAQPRPRPAASQPDSTPTTTVKEGRLVDPFAGVN